VVNASLNWASIVGIVLAVGGALLYFMRSFKPALARDYDVFFAAVGLLCGGILFFQGWRLDPILQFGQFLLAGSTVFFAYESVRLRGVTTEQARRSAYFEEEEPAPFRPRGGLGGSEWERERLDQSEPIRRRIPSRDEEDDFYRPRRSSRAAIPERAASRRGEPEDWNSSRRDLPAEEGTRRPSGRGQGWSEQADADTRPLASRYSAGGSRPDTTPFGARRQDRDSAAEQRRGSRPVPSSEAMSRSGRRPAEASGPEGRPAARPESATARGDDSRAGIPQGTPLRRDDRAASGVRDAEFSPLGENLSRAGRETGAATPAQPRGSSPNARDNSSRFDD